MRFKDRTVIVTGAGYGIGKQIALAFGRDGANVVLAARSQEKMEAVAKELKALGTQPLVVPLDQRTEPPVRDMVTRTLDRYARIDVLVNNSGIAGPTKLARDITAEEWLESMEVNLNGAFYCAKHVSAHMIAAKRGAIVNISSVAGRIGFPLRTPYAATKWGMLGLSHSLAAELGPYGIRVNAILPGPIEGQRLTDVATARAQAEGTTLEQVTKQWTAQVPLRRLITEQEVAEAVTFLCSDAASGITGQAFNVDGGFRMQ